MDFVHGALGGATGLLLSHPIDTIKSNIQDKRAINWNLRALYKGVVPPLFGVGLEKAIVFGTYENSKKELETRMKNEPSSAHSAHSVAPSVKNEHVIRGMSGALAGFTASFVVTPIERLKILRQTNEKFTLRELSPKFLYKGLSSTFTRETPGFGIYFSVYEGLKDYFGTKVELNTSHHLLFGGLSGSTAWLFIYPQDLVKTRIQASKQNINASIIIKSIYKEAGIKGFFRGFHLALLRAVPLHAGTFAMVEFLKKQKS